MAIHSAVLVELSAATGHVMPTTLAEVDALVKKVCQNESKLGKLWDTLSIESQNYLKGVIKAIGRNESVPLPSDYEDLTGMKRKKELEEEEDDPFLDCMQFDATTKLYAVKTLLDMKVHGQIAIPSFQRKDSVWSVQNKTLFLRGVLNGLPIPSITLSIPPGTQDRFLLDGLQRLTTLQTFMNGDIELDGRVWRTLSEHTRNKVLFMDVPVSEITTERVNWPSIFRFINKNGVPLNDIELRRALFTHPVLQKLEDISEQHELWMQIHGPNKRYKGLQVLFRSVAMSYGYREYTKGMTKFLDKVCAEWEKYPASIDADLTYEQLDKILWAIRNNSKIMFKTGDKNQINQGLVDCIFHAGFSILHSKPDINSESLAKCLVNLSKSLIGDPLTLHALTRDTSGVENVTTRMEMTNQFVTKFLQGVSK